jgi:hypothetical protein
MWTVAVTSTIGVVMVAIGLLADERRTRLVCLGIGAFLIVGGMVSCAKQLHDPSPVITIEMP